MCVVGVRVYRNRYRQRTDLEPQVKISAFRTSPSRTHNTAALLFRIREVIYGNSRFEEPATEVSIHGSASPEVLSQ